jgi:hypothetical protein
MMMNSFDTAEKPIEKPIVEGAQDDQHSFLFDTFDIE